MVKLAGPIASGRTAPEGGARRSCVAAVKYMRGEAPARRQCRAASCFSAAPQARSWSACRAARFLEQFSVSAIAGFMTERLGPRRAVLAVVLAGALVTYGGVSLFVAFFD
jgi:hypothetical protein